jgi:hypothetical protein
MAPALAPLAFEHLPHDLLLQIARHVGAVELARLACASRRFAEPPVADSSDASGGCESRSLVDEAARRWLLATCGPNERACLLWRSQQGRWVGLMREAELLRLPLVFSRLDPDAFSLSDDGCMVTATRWMDQTAACGTVMRAGRHFAQFELVEGTFMMLGVIRPSWDVVSQLHAHEQARHCFYHTGSGQRFPGRRPAKRKWTGIAHASKGDRVGLLLDLEQGSMAVYKNDERLGIMQESGLSGEYCWAVGIATPGYSVRIQPMPLPPPAAVPPAEPDRAQQA